LLAKARVLKIEEIFSGCFFLQLKERRIAGDSLPGQFLHVRIADNTVPFLRRPFSIAGASPRKGTVEIIFRVAGEGTRILSRLQKDDILDCLGPLGTPFSPGKGFPVSILLAGGVGIAPLLFLAGTLAGIRGKILVYYGAPRSGELFPLDQFLPPNAEVFLATEDGSAGFQGLVTDLFESSLTDGLERAEIFACGPEPMLKTLAGKNRSWGYPMQLSLEERMACGIGACQGCAVQARREGKTGYLRVCRDGPVFNFQEVIW
jgi:dihydroorotate dehydrogenase electron transfer subunit